MTDTKLAELKETARQILVYHRLQILNKHPFIGHIAMNLDLIPVRDARVRTAMTDGKTVYFDIDFLSRLTPDEIQFVLGHEFWHVVMLHFIRGEKYTDHNSFNVATDMEVNQILESDGFIPPQEVIFPNGNHSRKCQFNFPDNLSAEEYYELLKKAAEKKAQEQAQKNGNGNGSADNDTEDETEKESNTHSQDDGKAKSKRGRKKDNKEKCDGQFDKHFDSTEDQEEALKEAMADGAEDKYGEKGADEDYQPAQIKNESDAREAVEKVREAVVSSAQAYERSRGTLPGYIQQQVNKLLDSKLPWKELLAAFITAGFQNKSNWNSPNKRFAYSGTYLPSHTGDNMRIAIGIDTSGSCQDLCQRFLTELSAITKNFDSYELHVIQCDTEVKDYTLYDENNPLDPENPIEFKGFGGTRLHPIFNYLELNDIEVDAAVIFTDGECEQFRADENFDIPVLWTIAGRDKAPAIEVGEKIFIQE